MKKKSSYQKLKDEIAELHAKNQKLKAYIRGDLNHFDSLIVKTGVDFEKKAEKEYWYGESSYKTLGNGSR